MKLIMFDGTIETQATELVEALSVAKDQRERDIACQQLFAVIIQLYSDDDKNPWTARDTCLSILETPGVSTQALQFAASIYLAHPPAENSEGWIKTIQRANRMLHLEHIQNNPELEDVRRRISESYEHRPKDIEREIDVAFAQASTAAEELAKILGITVEDTAELDGSKGPKVGIGGNAIPLPTTNYLSDDSVGITDDSGGINPGAPTTTKIIRSGPSAAPTATTGKYALATAENILAARGGAVPGQTGSVQTVLDDAEALFCANVSWMKGTSELRSNTRGACDILIKALDAQPAPAAPDAFLLARQLFNFMHASEMTERGMISSKFVDMEQTRKNCLAILRSPHVLPLHKHHAAIILVHSGVKTQKHAMSLVHDLSGLLASKTISIPKPTHSILTGYLNGPLTKVANRSAVGDGWARGKVLLKGEHFIEATDPAVERALTEALAVSMPAPTGSQKFVGTVTTAIGGAGFRRDGHADSSLGAAR